jgi:hypothetical protein
LITKLTDEEVVIGKEEEEDDVKPSEHDKEAKKQTVDAMAKNSTQRK